MEAEPIFSDLELRFYKALRKKHEHVFPQQAADVFLVKEVVLGMLEPGERRIFPNLWFSFVCTDLNYLPTLVIHHKKDSKLGDIAASEKRLQKRVFAIAKIPFWQLDSDDKIRDALASLEDEKSAGCEVKSPP